MTKTNNWLKNLPQPNKCLPKKLHLTLVGVDPDFYDFMPSVNVVIETEAQFYMTLYDLRLFTKCGKLVSWFMKDDDNNTVVWSKICHKE